MRFGILMMARDLQAVGPIARLGEEQGFDLVGLADSPSLAHDPYVALTLVAQATRRARIGVAVTNTQTRHPLIIANLAASLELLAPGRSFLGLGTGNSGVRHAGAAPATLANLAAGIGLIRRLLSGESAEVNGATVGLKLGGGQVPILLAGSGPRSLRLAGRLADVAFFNLGVSPEIVSAALGWIAEGAEQAGRAPTAVEPWLYTVASIGEDGSRARDAAGGAVMGTAAYALRGEAAAGRLSPEMALLVERLLREYDYGEHFAPGQSANYRLAQRLGLADYLLDRFAIAGSPEQVRRQLEALRAVGLRNVCFNLAAAADLPGSLRLFGQGVLPTLRE